MKFIAWVRKEDGKIIVKPWLVALAKGEIKRTFNLALWKFGGVWSTEEEAANMAAEYVKVNK